MKTNRLKSNLLQSNLPILAGALFATAAAPALAIDITGAGASFPAPIYAKWAEAYKAKTGNALNYQSIGSGGGVKQIIAKTVDFGASDDPIPGADLEKSGLVQFPAVIGGVVPVINVPGIQPGQLTLNADVLAAIFAGKITKWNDGAIARLNPSATLPDRAISPIYRSDSSGTTAVFTTYIAEKVPTFEKDVGAGKTVNWPVGVGGRGNAGVAANVSKIAGSIGYVEYAYAKQNKLTHTGLINTAGKTVQPSDKTFAAAAASADWTKAAGLGVSLNNQPGDEAWPITSASYILMQKQPTDAAKATEVLKFFKWALADGQQLALDLDYVPMPAKTIPLIEGTWKEIQGISAGSL